MSNDLIVHRSISDLYRSLNLPIDQDLDFTIHFLPELHAQIPFSSPVFRADYFSFVFVKAGEGHYTLDNQEHRFEDRTVYFTNPGHIKSFSIDCCGNAYIITLTESFLTENVHADIFTEFPFLLAEFVPPQHLEAEEFAELEELYMQILKESRSTSRYRKKMLGNLFVVLLLKMKEKFWEHYDPLEEGDRTSQIVHSFKRMLEDYFSAHNDKQLIHPQVQDFAHQLNLHPAYFSQVISSKTGKTVNQWISDRTLSAAKTLLRNTGLSSKEISFRLGFSEPTHFGRFFKKQEGTTPLAYRKAAR